VLPLPNRLKLVSFFEGEARSLQDFVRRDAQAVARSRREATPRVTNEHVFVWYGSADKTAVALEWEPFNRAEHSL
jgi:hypothetical protein